MKPNNSISKTEMIFLFLKSAVHFFVLALIFTIAGSLADMIRPKIISYTVDALLGTADSTLTGAAGRLVEMCGGAERLRSELWMPALAVILCTLFSVVCNYFYQVAIAKGGETFVKQMRDQLFAHIEKLPVQWHSEHQTGDIIQRCTTDVEEVKGFLSDQLVTLVRMVITIALAVFFMLQINIRLGLAASASIPLLILFSIWFHGKISNSFRICDESEGVLSTIAQENLTGVRVVRAFGREYAEQQRFADQNTVVTDNWVKLGKYFSFYIAAGDMMTGVIMVTVLAWGSAMCVHGQLTVGDLLADITYLTMLIRPVRGMGRVLSEMSKTGVSITRLHDIMSAPVEEDPSDATEPPMNRDIVFSHVNFAFPGQPNLLSDLDFTVKAGSTLGILGSTGSGKSTIAHLLARLYPLSPEKGQITVGGVDLQQMKASWVRRNVGFVLQEPFLFSRSISENISIAEENMEEADIRSAARLACLEAAVDDFPNGFDTFVGERGVTLSGGQKQRAAIARTLTSRAPILIFDDSLSAVDAETDEKIRRNLKKSMKEATTILISHRITTLMAADQILVLENGRITDRGTHQELINRPGLYRRIYEIQSGKEEESDE